MTGVSELEQLGPYRLHRELGTGAMGTVYLAEDAEDDRLIALKVLHPHLVRREGFFQRFEREAFAGERVRHENVVGTLDCGVHIVGETAYCVLAMEYVEGRTLRDLIRDLGTVPEALVREIASQVAAGLAAIHAAGIVHRDLKPENVLITADHKVRIMDLGVARLNEASTALTREGQFAGSLLYAAPEQFGRGAVEARSDLYALGVLLYELVTGQNPFHRDRPEAVMRAHLEETPERLDHPETGCSPFLAEVVATLLRKPAVDRIGSAGELHDLLEAGESSRWWVERESRLLGERARKPRVPVRRGTAVYGREADRAFLESAWEQARTGEGGAVLLEGEAGIGKSRLLDLFLKTRELEDAHVLYGSYAPAGGLGAIADSILGHVGSGSLERALEPYLRPTPTLLPAFASMLRREARPTGSAALRAGQLQTVCVNTMRTLAAERPLLWIIEDLHFADGIGRAIATALARAVFGHRVLLLLTTRPEFPAADVLQLHQVHGLAHRRLDRLGARDVVRLLRDALRNERLVEKLGSKIAEHSDGVPFFVFEMIRGLKEGQFLSELPDGTWVESRAIEEIEVPSAVRSLIEVRLRDLSDVERAILDVGAVLGYEFDPDLVARVLGRSHVDVLQRLAAIERRSGILRATGRAFHFDHHQIQECLYADLPEGLREEYHTLLAEQFMERLREGTADDEIGQLDGHPAWFMAWHGLRGKAREQALPFLDGTLEFLEGSCCNEAALELGQRALASEGLITGRSRSELLLRIASEANLLARRDVERRLLDEARELARASGDPALLARAWMGVARYSNGISDYEEARRAALTALEFLVEEDDAELEVQLRLLLSAVLSLQGRFRDAEVQLDLVQETAPALGDAHVNANVLRARGSLCFLEGRHEEALSCYEAAQLGVTNDSRRLLAEHAGALARVFSRLARLDEAWEWTEKALALEREIGNRLEEGRMTNGLGLISLALGNYADGRDHFERYLELSREIGDRQGEAVATGNLGEVARHLGSYEQARMHYERWFELAEVIGDFRSQVMATGNLGYILTSLGRPEEARPYFDVCLERARDAGDKRQEAGTLPDLARLEAYIGEAARAEVHYRQALGLQRAYDALGVHHTLIDLAGLLLAQGRPEEARPLLEEASVTTDRPEASALAAVLLALLPGGDPARAEVHYLASESRITFENRMQGRFLLWRSTSDPRHLEEAHHLLQVALEDARPEDREAMVENVPVHREVTEAWETHGAGS